MVISAYLKSKGINFRTDRILRVEGRLISVNYLLQGSNIMIKYWDPAGILALEKQPDHVQNCYKNYLNSWKQFIGEFYGRGGKILQIVESDNLEILAELLEFEELNLLTEPAEDQPLDE